MNNGNVGDVIRLNLRIPDLVNDSGIKQDLFYIDKIFIKKIENSFVTIKEDENICIISGPTIAKLSGKYSNSIPNFLDLLIDFGQGIEHITVNSSYYVKIKYPEFLTGIYRLENTLIESYENNKPISNHLYVNFPTLQINDEEILFDLLDENLNLIRSYDSGTITIDNYSFVSSPLWRNDICYFEDLDTYPQDFKNLDLSTTKYLHILSGNYEGRYIINRLYGIKNISGNDYYNSLVIIGYPNSSICDINDAIQWAVEDENYVPLYSGYNGIIKYIYNSPVFKETYTNSTNNEMYGYYIDWYTDRYNNVREGTYSVSWYYKRNENSTTEISTDYYFIFDDFILTQESNSQFNRNNYYEFVQNYIPFFYKDYQIDEYLTLINQTFSESIYDVKALVDNMQNVLDAEIVQKRFLPYLSNLYSYSLKGDDSISWRQQILYLMRTLKKKGTAQGLIDILSLMEVDVNAIIFYWQIISKYLWSDYFIVKNDNSQEEFDLTYNPIVQILCVNNLKTPEYSRYSLRYYSQLNSKWYNVYIPTNIFDILNCETNSIDEEKIVYNKNVIWQNNGIINIINDLEQVESIQTSDGDIVLLRYQHNKYPISCDIDSNGYEYTSFDQEEIIKDDLILNLELADKRFPYDSSYIDNKLIPLVNYNAKLFPDSDSLILRNGFEFDLENVYKISDLCSKVNPIKEPLIYGYIRTKFPWSENVYNMDEYDGSTRPSYLPEDIDDDFLDTCSCAWSNYFSLNVNIPNLSDKTLNEVVSTITEFKPMHSALHNLIFSSKLTDYCNVFDGDILIQLKYNNNENVNIAYYSLNNNYSTIGIQRRSNTFLYYQGEFSTQSSDMKILLEDNLGFKDIQLYTYESGPPIESKGTRVSIETTTGIHALKQYQISAINDNSIQLHEDVDPIPSPPYSIDGPWKYSLYNPIYPSKYSSLTLNADITKSGKFIINNSSDFSELMIKSDLDQEYNYNVIIYSGGTPGTYNVIYINDNEITIDYPFGNLVGDILFSIYRNSELLEDFDNINGTIVKLETYGIAEIIGEDFTSKNIHMNDYVYIYGNYYPVINILQETITVSNYALGPVGNYNIEIYRKILTSETGYIKGYTNILHDIQHVIPIDFDLINRNFDGTQNLDNVVIGIDYFDTGYYNYFKIKSIIDSSTIEIDEYFEDVIASKTYVVRINELSLEEKLIPDWKYYQTIYDYQDIVVSASGQTLTTTYIEDLGIDYTTYNIRPGDIIILNLSDSGNVIAYVLSVSTNRLYFSIPIVIGISDTLIEYNVIRRRFFDNETQNAKQDLVKIKINPDFDFMVQIQNIIEITGGYEIQMEGEGENERIDIDNYRTTVEKKYFVGSKNETIIVDDNRIELVFDETQEQQSIAITDPLKIDHDNIHVSVNNVSWTRVYEWPDEFTPDTRNANIYLVEIISDNYIKIWFGNGFIGRKLKTGDLVNVYYDHFGLTYGPMTPEKQLEKENAIMVIKDQYDNIIAELSLV